MCVSCSHTYLYTCIYMHAQENLQKYLKIVSQDYEIMNHLFYTSLNSPKCYAKQKNRSLSTLKKKVMFLNSQEANKNCW